MASVKIASGFISAERNKHFLKHINILALSLFATTTLFAAPPSTQSLLQQQEELTRLPKLTPANIQTAPQPEKPAAPIISNIQVAPKVFSFQGNITIFTQSELEAMAAPYIGKKQGIEGLYDLLEVIRNAYREKGYTVVRVFFPLQDITEGNIVIKIIEAIVDDTQGSIKIQGKDLRVNENYALKIVKKALQPGTILKQENLERAILLVNDMPGLSATANMTPGVKENSTGVTAEVTEGKKGNYFTSLNNSGNRYTGLYTWTLGADIKDISGYGDDLKVSGVKTLGYGDQNLYSVDYSSNVGYDGWRVGANFAKVKYSLGGDYKSADIAGTATTQMVYATYPIYRTSLTNLRFNTAYKNTNTEGTTQQVVSSKDTLRNFTNTLAADHSDKIWGGGFTSLSASYTTGSDAIEDAAQLALDQGATGPHVDGSFRKYNINFSRIQRAYSPDYYFLVNASLQQALTNLPGAEQFSLGGSAGVRAYPSGEGAGDSGLKATLEANYVLMKATDWGDVRVKGFYDYGRIMDVRYEYYDGWTELKHYSLQGWGVGLDFGKPNDFDVSVSIATPIGKNPVADATTGFNSDGQKQQSRVWFQVQKYW